MTKQFDRREALILAGGLASAAAAPAAARDADKTPGAFRAMPLPVAAMFPRTRYFEIDSIKAGARYAVWVTVPTSYDQKPDQPFPAIYMPDGNHAVMLSPRIGNAGNFDPINPVQSSIQIAVGYTGDDSKYSLAVRARDLLPPKEALTPGMTDAMRKSVSGNILDKAGTELYIHNLENPAGDRFHAFLAEELHPFIATNYRVQPDSVGLFGHSYGGLFATYAALQKKTIFRNFGASSPGILAGRSRIFELYADALASGGLSERNLHMTVGVREVTAPTLYAARVGAGTTEFIARAVTTPLKGLNFTSKLIEDESHMSVDWPAAYSFLRTLYPATT